MSRLVVIILVVALFWGCSQRSQTETDQSGLTDSVLMPDSEVFGATIYLFDRQEVTTEIRADRIRRFANIDSTMGYVLDIDFFDSLGQISSNLVGDSGVIREASNELEVFGEVVVIASEGYRLDTEYLRWDPTVGMIRSDAYVKFTRGSTIISGWGMEAEPNLRNLVIFETSGSVEESELKDN